VGGGAPGGAARRAVGSSGGAARWRISRGEKPGLIRPLLPQL